MPSSDFISESREVGVGKAKKPGLSWQVVLRDDVSSQRGRNKQQDDEETLDDVLRSQYK